MNAHVQQASVLNGRSMTMMAVIGLHALIISALVLIKVVPPLVNDRQSIIDVFNIPPDEQPPPPKPLPVEPTKLPPIAIPQIIIPPIDMPPSESSLVAEVMSVPADDIGPAQVEAGSGTGPVVPVQPARTSSELKYRAVMSPDVFYPATSVSLQEQGVAVVQLCVGPSGKIDGKPTIQTSSGYKRLDQAAIKWAQEALRFTPATENGAAIRACKGFRVVFDLN
jgi:protein TonB